MSIPVDVHGNTDPLVRDITAAVDRINKSGRLKIQLDSRGVTQPLGRMTRSADEFTKSLEASNARVLAFGASVGVINAVSQAFKGLVQSTIEVQKNLTDINIVMGLTSRELDKFGGGLMKVAKETGAGFKAASDAATEFARQGLGVAETLKRTSDALILTRLTGMEAADSVRSITAAMNTFGHEVKNSTELVSKFAAVDVKFAVSAGDFAQAISRAGQSAKQAGVDLDTFVGMVTAAQERTARGGAVIGNALKTIFTRVQKPQTLRQLESLGIAVRDVSGRTIEADKIIQSLAKSWDSLTDAQRASTGQTVAGMFQINILKAVMADMAKQNNVTSEAMKISARATDESTKKNEALRQTMSALAGETGVAVQELAKKIGDIALAPGITQVLDSLKGMAESLGGMLGDGEDEGNRFAKGLLKGVGNILTGPGLVIFAAVAGKLFFNAFKYAKDSLGSLLNINKAATRRITLEQSLMQVITKSDSIMKEMLRTDTSREAKQKIITDLIRQQTREAERLASLTRSMSGPMLKMGITPDLSIKKAAGHVPNYSSAATQEKREAAKGGYVAGKIKQGPGFVYNDKEEWKEFPGLKEPGLLPPKPSKASKKYTKDFYNKHKFDPYAAGGHVPNFAIAMPKKSWSKQNALSVYNSTATGKKAPSDEERAAAEKWLRGGNASKINHLDQYNKASTRVSAPGLKQGKVGFLSAAEKPGNVRNDVIDARRFATMLVPTIGADTVVQTPVGGDPVTMGKQVAKGKFQKGAEVGYQGIAAPGKTIYGEKLKRSVMFNVMGLDPGSIKGVGKSKPKWSAKSIMAGLGKEGYASLGTKLANSLDLGSGEGAPKKINAQQLIDEMGRSDSGASGALNAMAGSMFEAAVNTRLGIGGGSAASLIDGKSPLGGDFDVRSGKNKGMLDKLFGGSVAPLADYKNAPSEKNMKSFSKKVLQELAFQKSPLLKLPAGKKLMSQSGGVKYGAGGFVPNFAGMPVPPFVTEMAREIKSAGGNIQVVGGAPRDFLRDPTKAPKDWDVEVFGISQDRLQEILTKKGALSADGLIGKSFGVFKAKSGGQDFEFTMPRREKKTGKGHKDFKTVVDPRMSKKNAAKRRDLTINAIGYNPLTKKFIDPLGGIEDLKKGVMRPTSSRFKEDPLRVLRAMQFGGRMDLKAHPELIKYSKEMVNEFGTIPKERVYEEMKKLATKSTVPSKGLQFLKDSGWSKHFPELDRLSEIKQSPKWHAEGDVFEHTKMVTDKLVKQPGYKKLKGDEREDMFWAGLGHDFGKYGNTQTDAKGNISSRGHASAGVPATASFLGRFMPKGRVNTKMKTIGPGIRYHMDHAQGGTPSDKMLRRRSGAFGQAGGTWNMEKHGTLMRADVQGRIAPGQPRGSKYLDAYDKGVKNLGIGKAAPTMLVTGKDLMNLGMPQGPEIGMALKTLMNAQLSGKFKTKAQGLEWFKRYESYGQGEMQSWDYAGGYVPNYVRIQGKDGESFEGGLRTRNVTLQAGGGPGQMRTHIKAIRDAARSGQPYGVLNAGEVVGHRIPSILVKAKSLIDRMRAKGEDIPLMKMMGRLNPRYLEGDVADMKGSVPMGFSKWGQLPKGDKGANLYKKGDTGKLNSSLKKLGVKRDSGGFYKDKDVQLSKLFPMGFGGGFVPNFAFAPFSGGGAWQDYADEGAHQEDHGYTDQQMWGLKVHKKNAHVPGAVWEAVVPGASGAEAVTKFFSRYPAYKASHNVSLIKQWPSGSMANWGPAPNTPGMQWTSTKPYEKKYGLTLGSMSGTSSAGLRSFRGRSRKGQRKGAGGFVPNFAKMRVTPKKHKASINISGKTGAKPRNLQAHGKKEKGGAWEKTKEGAAFMKQKWDSLSPTTRALITGAGTMITGGGMGSPFVLFPTLGAIAGVPLWQAVMDHPSAMKGAPRLPRAMRKKLDRIKGSQSKGGLEDFGFGASDGRFSMNAGGFIPNYASPLGSAIGREASALSGRGIPTSQIRVGAHRKLVAPSNPGGIGVTNTTDEPNGLRDVLGAGSGVVPNFSVGGSVKEMLGIGLDQTMSDLGAELETLTQEVQLFTETVEYTDKRQLKYGQAVGDAQKEVDRLKADEKSYRDGLRGRKIGSKNHQRVEKQLTIAEDQLKSAELKQGVASKRNTKAKDGLTAAENKLKKNQQSQTRVSGRQSRSGMIGMGAMMAMPMIGGMLDPTGSPLNEEGTGMSYGGAASSAMTGASTGLMMLGQFGVWGKVIGGVGGALWGLANAADAAKEALEKKAKEEARKAYVEGGVEGRAIAKSKMFDLDSIGLNLEDKITKLNIDLAKKLGRPVTRRWSKRGERIMSPLEYAASGTEGGEHWADPSNSGFDSGSGWGLFKAFARLGMGTAGAFGGGGATATTWAPQSQVGTAPGTPQYGLSLPSLDTPELRELREGYEKLVAKEEGIATRNLGGKGGNQISQQYLDDRYGKDAKPGEKGVPALTAENKRKKDLWTADMKMLKVTEERIKAEAELVEAIQKSGMGVALGDLGKALAPGGEVSRGIIEDATKKMKARLGKDSKGETKKADMIERAGVFLRSFETGAFKVPKAAGEAFEAAGGDGTDTNAGGEIAVAAQNILKQRFEVIDSMLSERLKKDKDYQIQLPANEEGEIKTVSAQTLRDQIKQASDALGTNENQFAKLFNNTAEAKRALGIVNKIAVIAGGVLKGWSDTADNLDKQNRAVILQLDLDMAKIASQKKANSHLRLIEGAYKQQLRNIVSGNRLYGSGMSRIHDAQDKYKKTMMDANLAFEKGDIKAKETYRTSTLSELGKKGFANELKILLAGLGGTDERQAGESQKDFEARAETTAEAKKNELADKSRAAEERFDFTKDFLRSLRVELDESGTETPESVDRRSSALGLASDKDTAELFRYIHSSGASDLTLIPKMLRKANAQRDEANAANRHTLELTTKQADQERAITLLLDKRLSKMETMERIGARLNKQAEQATRIRGAKSATESLEFDYGTGPGFRGRYSQGMRGHQKMKIQQDAEIKNNMSTLRTANRNLIKKAAQDADVPLTEAQLKSLTAKSMKPKFELDKEIRAQARAEAERAKKARSDAFVTQSMGAVTSNAPAGIASLGGQRTPVMKYVEEQLELEKAGNPFDIAKHQKTEQTARGNTPVKDWNRQKAELRALDIAAEAAQKKSDDLSRNGNEKAKQVAEYGIQLRDNLDTEEKVTTELERQLAVQKELIDQREAHVTGPGSAGRGFDDGLGALNDEMIKFRYNLTQSIPKDFSNALGGALHSAIRDGEKLGDTLRKAAIGFLDVLNQKFMGHFADQITVGLFGPGKDAAAFNKGGQVPAMVTNGEFVMSKKATEHYGPEIMGGLNRGRLPIKRQDGGLASFFKESIGDKELEEALKALAAHQRKKRDTFTEFRKKSQEEEAERSYFRAKDDGLSFGTPGSPDPLGDFARKGNNKWFNQTRRGDSADLNPFIEAMRHEKYTYDAFNNPIKPEGSRIPMPNPLYLSGHKDDKQQQFENIDRAQRLSPLGNDALTSRGSLPYLETEDSKKLKTFFSTAASDGIEKGKEQAAGKIQQIGRGQTGGGGGFFSIFGDLLMLPFKLLGSLFGMKGLNKGGKVKGYAKGGLSQAGGTLAAGLGSIAAAQLFKEDEEPEHEALRDSWAENRYNKETKQITGNRPWAKGGRHMSARYMQGNQRVKDYTNALSQKRQAELDEKMKKAEEKAQLGRQIFSAVASYGLSKAGSALQESGAFGRADLAMGLGSTRQVKGPDGTALDVKVSPDGRVVRAPTTKIEQLSSSTSIRSSNVFDGSKPGTMPKWLGGSGKGEYETAMSKNFEEMMDSSDFMKQADGKFSRGIPKKGNWAERQSVSETGANAFGYTKDPDKSWGGNVLSWMGQQLNPGNFSWNRKNSGGKITGQPGIDKIPAMLTEGEYVINADAVRNIGEGPLNDMNKGRYASGGIVSDAPKDRSVGTGSENTNNITITVNVDKSGGTSEASAETGNEGENDRMDQFSARVKEQVVTIIKEESRPGGMLDNGG